MQSINIAEVCASPAKRRKTCGESKDDFELQADAGLNIKSASSRLKSSRFKTPKKVKQAHEEPHTPGSHKDMQQSILSPQQMAPNLVLLNQLLGAIYVTLPMVRSRGKATTYQNMRGPVQNFCGRDFQVKHLQQIKALCPDALVWEHITAFNPTTKRQEQQLCISLPADPSNPKLTIDTTSMQQRFFERLLQRQACSGSITTEDYELPLAELPPPAGPSVRDCTPGRQRSSGLLPSTPQTAPPAAGAFAYEKMSPPPKRVVTAAKGLPASSLMSPPPAHSRALSRRLVLGTEGDKDLTFSPAAAQPHQLLSPRGGGGYHTLSTPARSDADRPPTAPGGNVTPVLRPNRLFDTPVHAATPEQSSAARPNTHVTPEAAVNGNECKTSVRTAGAAAGVKVRKLTFDAAAPRPAVAVSAVMSQPVKASEAPAAQDGAVSTCNVAAPKPAASRTQAGLKFELGASTMALLKQVSSAEVKQEAAVKHHQLEQERVLDMLPGSFEVLRAVFGERGPCVKPQTEVIQLLRQKSTAKSGMSLADAAEQLELMLRLIPEFLRLQTSSGSSLAGITKTVRVNRQISWPAARSKLLAEATLARSSGSAVAAQAVAAERQREASEVIALTAAAVDLEDDDSDPEGDTEDEKDTDAGAGAREPAAGAVDELGLDILTEVDGNVSKWPCGDQTAKAVDLDSEVMSLLGSSKCPQPLSCGGAAGMVVSALAIRAPLKKGSSE